MHIEPKYRFDGHSCNHLWLRIVTAKNGHNAAGF
jgi:hypothetical protein